jgi:sugar phosphate isomerase/epimerase
MTNRLTRRDVLWRGLAAGAAAVAAGPLRSAPAAEEKGAKMRFGLVTYMWGAEWDLPTLIKNCQQAKVLGVELRTTHKHGVEPKLSAAQRAEVKKRLADSPIQFVSLGSAECFDHLKEEALAKAIETTKAFLLLSRDVGASGVKVRPNDLHKEVPHEQTIEQIGKGLNVVGKFAADLGQQVRLEVHGGCSDPAVVKQIMDHVTAPAVGVCWNSNVADLKGKGLGGNFDMLKARFGATAHVRELNAPDYPWQELIGLFVKMDYAGWLMLEASSKRDDYVAALGQQRELFDQMLAKARQKA